MYRLSVLCTFIRNNEYNNKNAYKNEIGSIRSFKIQ